MSIYALVFFLRHKVYLIGSDTFYYVSIADSIIQSGSALDLTFIPAQSLKTIQNGIVIFHILLSALGLGPESRLVSIVVINYLLHLSAIYPLYKIARRVGLEGDFPMAALLGVYVGAQHIYRLQLLPINDGVFNALSIWLTYLIIVALQGDCKRNIPGPASRVKRRPTTLALTIVLAAVLVHFRVNTVLILGSALIAAIVARRHRYGLWTLGFLSASVAALVLPYACTDISRISVQNDRIWSDLLSRLSANCFELMTQTVPDLLFARAGTRASLIYTTFALALVLALISGLRERRTGILFVSSSCSVAILFMTILPARPARYLVYVFPFLYLLILLPGQMRPIGYMFVALVLVSSLGTFFLLGFPREPASRFWLYLHEQHVTLPDEDPLLISESSRHSYFFLEARTFQDELTWDLVDSHHGLYLIGSDEFVTARLTEIESMAEEADFAFKRRNLTPGYQGEEGHVLLQLYDLAPDERWQP